MQLQSHENNKTGTPAWEQGETSAPQLRGEGARQPQNCRRKALSLAEVKAHLAPWKKRLKVRVAVTGKIF